MDDLYSLVNTYRESIIQSEAEVRTKLIVPLLKILGYPEKYRAEEFPVYGYSGRDKLPAKNADFILFSNENFGGHRTDTQKNIRWVQEHSLLIVEAKKPGKMPNSLGQAQYYTMWTRAVAYIETDGELFKAYLYNQSSPDFELIDISVDDIPNNNRISCLSFDSLTKIKENGLSTFRDRIQSTIAEGFEQILTNDKNLCLPDATYAYLRYAMGKNALRWSNIQLVNRFLCSTDSYLHNDLRYDIPAYMIDIPRSVYPAHLYLNNSIFPADSGKVMEFYRNEEVRYFYESVYIQAFVFFVNDELTGFELGYHIWDQKLSERIDHFQLVEKFLNSNQINISIEKDPRVLIQLPSGHPGKMWTSKEHAIELFNLWRSSLNKLKTIEEYYEIEFNLGIVSVDAEISSLYEAIDSVYDGIMLHENCMITLPGNLFDKKLVIEQPLLLKENSDIPLRTLTIQNIVFKPYKSTILPGNYDFRFTTKNDTIFLSGCVEYKVSQVLS